jgi:hypothetical protein
MVRSAFLIFALSLLVTTSAAAIVTTDHTRSLKKDKPKSKPKPGPGTDPKPKPGPGGGGGGGGDEGGGDSTHYCDEHFDRSDTTLSSPVSCGAGAVCLPTSESVIKAVGSYDIIAAMESGESLDIKCLKVAEGSEVVCNITHTNVDCTDDDFICVALAQPTCLEGCSDDCYEISTAQASPEVSDPAAELPVKEVAFTTFYVVNGGIAVVAMLFLAHRVLKINSQDNFVNVPTESGHELVFINEDEQDLGEPSF